MLSDRYILSAPRFSQGFTLIELSIVLVIIGLIVGGILAGQDLIRAAAIRAQISQIEKYNTAVHTFQGKYGYLPGDIPDPAAGSFGFITRGPAPTIRGEGDGNGFLEGVWGNTGTEECGICEQSGEVVVAWEDLSKAGLLDGSFNTAPITFLSSTLITDISDYIPPAKIGQGNYVYIYGGGYGYNSNNLYGDARNYYGISAVTGLGWSVGVASAPGMSTIQAYNIDQKVDDGLPMTGRVLALYANNGVIWAGSGMPSGTAPYTTATAGSATSCFDNSATANGTPGVAGATQHYSLEMNGGTAFNCALTFQFQ